MPPHGDELPSFSSLASFIPDSTQDLPNTPADVAQIPLDPFMGLESLDTDFIFDEGFPSHLPVSHLQSSDFATAPAAGPEDAVMLGVNAAATSQPESGPPAVPLWGGGHTARCCGTGTTEIQHLEVEDAQQFDSSSEIERLIEEFMPNEEPEEAAYPWFHPFKSAVRYELFETRRRSNRKYARGCRIQEEKKKEEKAREQEEKMTHLYLKAMVLRSLPPLANHCNIPADKRIWSIVRSMGPDSKGKKPHQGRWKEKSMKGMRAVADPSSAPGQQPYVGLKKTLLFDDGNGDTWHAHEYTALLPSNDGSNNLVPAEFALRFEFKEEEEEEEEEPPSSSSSKHPRNDALKDDPKTAPGKSHVWEHMTKLHVKVDATNNKDGTKRKKNTHYKVMYAICHHCDQVFNADSKNGTHNLSNHLDSCKCNFTFCRKVD